MLALRFAFSMDASPKANRPNRLVAQLVPCLLAASFSVAMIGARTLVYTKPNVGVATATQPDKLAVSAAAAAIF